MLDEIDKAEPDLPNGLLVALGSYRFRVDPLDELVERVGPPPLVLITSNDERSLSPAFLRRCIRLTLTFPDASALREVARLHVPNADPTIIEDLLEVIVPAGDNSQVSPAEFVDAVRAAVGLQARPGTAAWDRMLAVLRAPEGVG